MMTIAVDWDAKPQIKKNYLSASAAYTTIEDKHQTPNQEVLGLIPTIVTVLYP